MTSEIILHGKKNEWTRSLLWSHFIKYKPLCLPSLNHKMIWAVYMITVTQFFLKAAKILYNFLLASRLFYTCKCWGIRLSETSSKTYAWQANGRPDSATAFVTPTVGSLNKNHLASTFKESIPPFSSTGLQLDFIKVRSAKAQWGTVHPPLANTNSLSKRGQRWKQEQMKTRRYSVRSYSMV